MTQLVQALVLGLLIGGVYALMASGLTLIFGVMNIINVAHGALLILVAYVPGRCGRRPGSDPILLSVVMTPVMFGVGWLLYKGVLRGSAAARRACRCCSPSASRSPSRAILDVTAGNKFRSATPSYFNQSFRVLGISLPKAQVYGCLAALVLVLGLLYVVLTRTWTGRAIRATAQNASGAALVGIQAAGVAALAFALGAATTGVGGSVLRCSTRSSRRPTTTGSPGCSASSCWAAWAAWRGRSSAP